MPGPAPIFREIHRLRRHARDLQARIEQGPRALKAQQARVAHQEEGLRQAQEALKHLKVTVHSKEVTLKTTNQNVAKYEKQLNEAAGKKEYDALKTEIATARKAVLALEDEILDGMAETEDKTAQLPELEKALQRAREDLAKFEREQESRQAGFAEQLRQTQQAIATVEATLPAEVKPMYDRLAGARGDEALSGVQNQTCVACYTQITSQNYNDLIRGNCVLCKSCGRFLYLPE
jgi:predicted  nucleic acid-binding Zn-ribbon protein